MPYFARVFSPSDAVPPLDSLRALAGQYAATLTTSDEEADWETAELLYDEEEAPVDIERYLPATDGLFEEDLNDIRATTQGRIGAVTFEEAVDDLVTLRGEIVHTGKVPDSLRKKHVLAWRSFVEKAIDNVDDSCRGQCKALGV